MAILATSPAPAHERHIVVVVGDVGGTSDEIVTTLLRAGFDAIAVASASAMLALLADGFTPCGLVLDVDTPAVDAWTLWDAVRRRVADDPPAAVMLSASDVDAMRARAADVREFLRKPAAPERLIEAVERHCPRRLWPRFRAAEDR